MTTLYRVHNHTDIYIRISWRLYYYKHKQRSTPRSLVTPTKPISLSNLSILRHKVSFWTHSEQHFYKLHQCSKIIADMNELDNSKQLFLQTTPELQSNPYTFFTEVYLTELQPKDVPSSNVAKSCFSRYSTTKSLQIWTNWTILSNFTTKRRSYFQCSKVMNFGIL